MPEAANMRGSGMAASLCRSLRSLCKLGLRAWGESWRLKSSPWASWWKAARAALARSSWM